MSERDTFQPPSAYGTVPSYYDSTLQQNAAPRIGDWLSEAWLLFTREWQTWILQGLIVTLICGVPVVAGIIGMQAMYFSIGLYTPSSGSSSSTNTTALLTTMFGAMGVYYAGLLVASVIYAWLSIGMKRTAAKQLRGEPISVGDIWGGGDVFFPVLGATLLTLLASWAGSLLLCVGSLMASALLYFATPLITERKMGVMDALRRSWDTVLPHMWMYVLWILVLSLLLYLSASFCPLLMLAAMPIFTLCMMIAYRDAIGLPGALPPQIARVEQQAHQLSQAMPAVNYGPAGAPVAGAPCAQCGRALAVGAVVCPACQHPVQPGYPG